MLLDKTPPIPVTNDTAMFGLLHCQLRYIWDNSTILGVEKGRQLGFTWISAIKILRRIDKSPMPQDHYWISRDEFTAKLFLQDVLQWIDYIDTFRNHKRRFKTSMVKMEDIQAMKITFECGSSIYVMSSSPNAIAGKRGHIYIDEAALHKDFKQLYDIAKPATRWGFTLTFFSTHRSKNNYFYKLIERIKSGDIPEATALSINLVDALNDGYLHTLNRINSLVNKKQYTTNQEFFDEEKAQASSEEMFLQENMCVPADADAVQAVTEDDLRKMMRPQSEIFQSPRSGGRYFAGIDIGRNRDLTVFWVVEDISTSSHPLLVTRYVETMKKETFSTQERRLAQLIKEWRPYKCLIDGTNIGAGIAENLSERFGETVENIKITRVTRPLWISNLIGFTRRSETCLHVPDTNEVWEDFLSVERYINKEGKEDFFIPSHKERGHGDRFMALVLCLEAFTRCRSLARYTLESEGTLKTEVKSQKQIAKQTLKTRRRSRMSGF